MPKQPVEIVNYEPLSESESETILVETISLPIAVSAYVVPRGTKEKYAFPLDRNLINHLLNHPGYRCLKWDAPVDCEDLGEPNYVYYLVPKCDCSRFPLDGVHLEDCSTRRNRAI